jgi:hypothetical protein
MTAKMKKISLTIPAEVAEMLKEYVSVGKVSAYVSGILESHLKWERQKQAIKKYAGIWKAEDHPDLKTPEDTVKFIRSLRATSRDRLKRVGIFDDKS